MLRGDDSDAFGNFTTYCISDAWQVPGTGTRVHGSYGAGVVFPSLFEQFGVIPGLLTHNPDLAPEESQGYDIGVEQSFLDRKVIVDITYFNRNFENEIVSSFFGPLVNPEEESEREGIEVTARITPIDGLAFSGSYTYLQASGGDSLAEIRRPEHSGSVNVAYAFAEGRGVVDLGVIYNREMQDFAFDAFTYAQSPVTLEEYTVVSLAAHYDVTANVRLFGLVENVLNEDYQEVFGFETAPIAAYGGVKIRHGGERKSASLI